MQAPLLVIPIAIEWVILVTTVAPVLFINRFDSKPHLGIAVWFAALLSAGIALLCAMAIAIWGYLDTISLLRHRPSDLESWLMFLAISFAPWLVLAMGGISIALINQKLEPLLQTAKEIKPMIDAGKTPLLTFMRVAVFTVELPFAYALSTNREILLSRFTVEHLSQNELEAVLWHEWFHVRRKHFLIKQIARTIREISPGLAASRALVTETERLLELAANNYAITKTDLNTLKLARKIFS